MKISSKWLRSYLPPIPASDKELADALTLRGIAVDSTTSLVMEGHDAGVPVHDSVFEMDITTNRVDAMNHYGIAREAATIYGLPLARLDDSLPSSTPAAKPVSVAIEEPKLCGRFTARVLRDVTIRPSSGVVYEYFRLLEQKLISNAVDATNYVVLAMGHPTHAFDLDKLEGGIIVRKARRGEKLKTLDGVERTLDPDDLVVADERKALGIAGVIGGWDTMITPETKNVLVEAAWFDPATVRRSSKRHLVHTDASHRFERGADFNAPPLASALVSRIILEAGGTIEGDLIDVVIPEAEARTAKRSSIAFSMSEVRRILGPTEDPGGVTEAMAENILTGLGCGVEPRASGPVSGAAENPDQNLDPSRAVAGSLGTPDGGGASYQVTLPSWRLDLEREIDLIEEIARVYGYNRFRNTLPDFAGAVVELPWAAKESAVRRTLLALGWNEAIASSFCAAADAQLFAREPGGVVPIGNPLSEEAGMLRPSLLPGMLEMLGLNISRGVEGAALYEMGTVFGGSTDKVEERPALAFGATGSVFGRTEADFFEIKGTVEQLLGKFAVRSLYYDRFPAASGLMPAWLHPGRSARAVLDGATVGWFGQLHPAEAERRKLKQTVWLGELWLDRLYRQELRQPLIRELSRYQPVRRDFSLLLPDGVTWAAVAGAVQSLAIPELQGFEPKEVLRDKRGQMVPAGQYSLLLRVVFQSRERTLREEEVQAWSQQIIGAIEGLGGRLRETAQRA